MTDPGGVYRDTRSRVAELVRSLDGAGRLAPVPACPGWTVRDLLSHLAGLPADINAGRIDGAGTDPWTAAQLAARTGRSCDELLEEWEREAPAFEQILPVIKPPRPLYDVVVHEQDMRGAVGVLGGRDSEGVSLLFSVARDRLTAAFDEAGLPGLEVETAKGTFVAGTGEVSGRWVVDWFELFRSLCGRRSAAQITVLGCPEPYVEKLAFLPMPAEDVIEVGL